MVMRIGLNPAERKIKKQCGMILLFFFMRCPALLAQQLPDTGFIPALKNPYYPDGQGPLVLIDEAHHNFHTIKSRYGPFARILQKDGYRIQPNRKPFSKNTLKAARILVIANAVHESDTSEWIIPNPSAFTKEEIAAVKAFVENGGSLLFIADHMPMPGAGSALASAFGFIFHNGFATDTMDGLYPGNKKELDRFCKDNGTLTSHALTRGKTKEETVDSIATFTGQGFQIPASATSILTFTKNYVILLPDTAWKFNVHTKRKSAFGLSQGAVSDVGKGRLAIFGEAAMFTAQVKGKEQSKFGLNSKDAPHNLQFLLNTIHWLDRKI
jgi:hypothetical protein